MVEDKTDSMDAVNVGMPSDSGDSSDVPPICCDDIDPIIIGRWFDYWEHQDSKKSGRCGETIRKIRRVALAGARKSRRNNAAVAEVVAGILQGLAEDLRVGKIRIR